MKQIISFEQFKSQPKIENKLFAIIAGIRGSGKSTVLGTLNVPTLIITSSFEAHGVEAARAIGRDNILSVLYDIEEEKQLKADDALKNLHNILDFLINSEDILKNIQAVALDSVSAIDKTLLETTRIVTEKNNWTVIDLMEFEHLKILKKLKELHRKGLHVLTTMPILARFDEDGFYVSASPELRGTKTSAIISGSFYEILPITKYRGEYIFQMDLSIKKVSKDAQGNEKATIAHPRITGLLTQDLMQVSKDLILPADLDYVYKLKQAKGGNE